MTKETIQWYGEPSVLEVDNVRITKGPKYLCGPEGVYCLLVYFKQDGHKQRFPVRVDGKTGETWSAGMPNEYRKGYSDFRPWHRLAKKAAEKALKNHKAQ